MASPNNPHVCHPIMPTPTSSSSVPPSEHPNVQNVVKRKRTKKGRTVIVAGRMQWPWISSLPMTEYENKEQRLHDEIAAYVSYILPTAQERRAREQVVSRIEDVIKRRFSDAILAVFGSTAQNLYLPDADVDLVLTVPRELTHEGKKKMLFQLSAALRNCLITRDVQVLHQARVPILSFRTVPELGSFKIDISINSPDGVRAIPVISGYVERMPALRYLIMVVKGYLSRLRLNSASEGGLSSYSLICLIISFLQLNPQKCHIDDIQKPLEREALGRLLLGFYDYYANHFDYTHSCISVSQGKLLSKESRGWQMPSHPDHLCIECLIDPDHDIGRPTGKVKQIRAAFREAHFALQSYPFTMTHNNALGTILGVSSETLARRENLQEIVNSGSLERALRAIKLPPPYTRSRRQNYQNNWARAPYAPPPPVYQGGYGMPAYDPVYPYFGGSYAANTFYSDRLSYGSSAPLSGPARYSFGHDVASIPERHDGRRGMKRRYA